MSTWSYIQGAVRLSTGAMKEKLNKDGTYKLASEATQEKYFGRFEKYIPYPEEQITIGYPEAVVYPEDNAKPIMKCRMTVISYPIIKRAVEKYIDILPSGESSKIGYFLNYNKEDLNSSTSCFECKTEEDYFKKYVMEHVDLWSGATWKDVEKYRPHEVSWVESNDEATLTFCDSIRYCESAELYEKLIEFFKALVADDIGFDNGILTFNQDHYYYGASYEMTFDNGSIEVKIKEKDKEDRIERWQEFYTYEDAKYTQELKKVDEFLKYEDRYKDLRTPDPEETEEN